MFFTQFISPAFITSAFGKSDFRAKRAEPSVDRHQPKSPQTTLRFIVKLGSFP
jgi:hypothetical protein